MIAFIFPLFPRSKRKIVTPEASRFAFEAPSYPGAMSMHNTAAVM
jgi:hypothetical protein